MPAHWVRILRSITRHNHNHSHDNKINTITPHSTPQHATTRHNMRPISTVAQHNSGTSGDTDTDKEIHTNDN